MVGLIRQPKYGHLKELHKAVKMCEKALVSADPIVTSLGSSQQVFLLVFCNSLGSRHLSLARGTEARHSTFSGLCLHIRIRMFSLSFKL